VALRLPKQNYQDLERVIEFDFVRATEAAALNSLRWLGRGDKEAADAAACDAMRSITHGVAEQAGSVTVVAAADRAAAESAAELAKVGITLTKGAAL